MHSIYGDKQSYCALGNARLACACCVTTGFKKENNTDYIQMKIISAPDVPDINKNWLRHRPLHSMLNGPEVMLSIAKGGSLDKTFIL